MRISQNPESIAKLKRLATRARDDYFFLCQKILGYKDLRPDPHQELCDVIEKAGKRKKLILMPRNSFKSSCVTVGYAIRCILRNPDIRILITGETQKNAKRFVNEIKSHFESNKKLIALFGDYVGDRIWRDDELLISKRSRVLKESTITASGLEKMTVVGQHYDMIIVDDPVSQHNVNNPDQINRTIDSYKLLLSVLEPGLEKKIVIIGTRWSLNDLYGWILDPTGSEREQFDIVEKQAIDDEGKLLLPHILTKEFLDEAKRTQGDYIFNCQYQNKAISSETATFNASQIKYYETPPQGLIYFMTVDPAVSTGAYSDFSGIIVNGVDSSHNWFIHEALQLRVAPSDLVDKLFELAHKYQPMMCLGMEKYILEKFLKTSLLEEMGKRKQYFAIKEIDTDNKVSKEVRIRSLQPRFQSGQVYLKKDQVTLYNQITFHPQLKNDDVLDALKSQIAITFPAPFVAKAENDRYSSLPVKDQKMWLEVDKIAKRKVRQVGSWEI